ncbi:ROK family protein [uncultured Tenacibaculum sp.]|uniref:ROK family protein n=1 Tax=uncultured Tenacibaculum sp. TaxID=174713 RepID=UPI0026387DDD|nr:ROK family protein [uncultured Tenacibaculum sp.]
MNFLKSLCISTFLFFCFSCNNNKKEEEKIKFSYTAKLPKNGILKGVVELGTSGFNYFIVEIDENKNWKLKEAAYGKSLIAEAMTTTDEIDRKLNKFLTKIEALGVAKEHINFVVSSGALKEEVTQLIIEELKKRAHVIKEISPKEEAIYSLKAILPEAFKKNAFVVDLGSGNTKISFVENGKLIGKETHGSKYHQKGTEDDVVYNDVKEVATLVPEENRKFCFLIGGIPFQLAKEFRKEEERYTVLSSNIRKFDKVKEEKGKKIESGLTIYKAIVDATGCQNFIFDWETNFTIGYLLEKEGL